MLTPDDVDLHLIRAHRQEAERAIDAFTDALDLAGLPPMVSLEARRITATPTYAHVEVGGCSARTLQAIADRLAAHARCTGRVIHGEILPPGLAELPPVRGELSA